MFANIEKIFFVVCECVGHIIIYYVCVCLHEKKEVCV